MAEGRQAEHGNEVGVARRHGLDAEAARRVPQQSEAADALAFRTRRAGRLRPAGGQQRQQQQGQQGEGGRLETHGFGYHRRIVP